MAYDRKGTWKRGNSHKTQHSKDFHLFNSIDLFVNLRFILTI